MPATKSPAAKKPMAKNLSAGGSYLPKKSAKQIIHDFAELWRENDGPYANECQWAAEAIFATCESQTFSYFDFEIHANAFDLDRSILQDYFAELIKALKAGGAVKEIMGAYNYPVFSFLT